MTRPETGGKRAGCIAAALLAAALALTPGAAPAAEGSRGGTFLPLGWDARGQALGGAGALLVRDESAAYWNPANLVFLDSWGAGIGTVEPFPGLTNRYTVISAGTGLLDARVSRDGLVSVRRLALAVSVSHLGLDLAAGSAWNEGSAGLSVAWSFNAYNYVGLSWRVLKSWTDLEDAGSWGSAVDIGFTTRVSDRIWLAAVAKDGWSTIHYPHRHERIDPSLVLACSVERILGRVSVEGDMVMREGEIHSIRIGGELTLVEEILSMQAGVDARAVDYSRTIPWFGVTAGYAGARISIALGFDPEDELGRQTRVSADYRF
jgi:hypothetical protein